MDLERAMEFLLEQQAAHQARADAEMADIRATLARVATQQEIAQRHGDRTEATLRRAIRASVEEHRRERTRRQDLDQRLSARMEELAKAQAETQQTLKSFIESLKQPRNGHDTV